MSAKNLFQRLRSLQFPKFYFKSSLTSRGYFWNPCFVPSSVHASRIFTKTQNQRRLKKTLTPGSSRVRKRQKKGILCRQKQLVWLVCLRRLEKGDLFTVESRAFQIPKVLEFYIRFLSVRRIFTVTQCRTMFRKNSYFLSLFFFV